MNPARGAHVADLVAAARPAVFWSDREDAPTALDPLRGPNAADLVVIGAGFTGLWTALQAIHEQPGRNIVVLESQESGFGASTRNGGFCSASLTHGLAHGADYWPDEIATLLDMGDDNLNGLIETCETLGIDAGIERTGQLEVATAEWQIADLKATAALAAEHGRRGELLDQDEVRAQVNSPQYLAGYWDPNGTAMVDPARLVWGLRQACLDAGVRIHEHTKVTSVERNGRQLTVESEGGSIVAHKVIAATNAWAEPDRSMRRYVMPIYDHVLMTEPLSDSQMASIGWANRQGTADSANQFHYFRLTDDNRILWGGYDANYYRNNGMGPRYEERIDSHITIAHHFFDMFPQLEGLGFSHRWAGPIGTTSRFTAAFGARHDGDFVWVGGYTGLGVGAARWGARVALDLVDGHTTERTSLEIVRDKPFPLPPEPLRYPLIQFTRRQITKADRNEGRPGLWLRLLDRFGVGFDS